MAREELHSVESVLEKYVPAEELVEVKRILFGKPAESLTLSEEVLARAGEEDYEVSGWRISALSEETRPPREVGQERGRVVLISVDTSGQDWADTEQDRPANRRAYTGPGELSPVKHISY